MLRCRSLPSRVRSVLVPPTSGCLGPPTSSGIWFLAREEQWPGPGGRAWEALVGVAPATSDPSLHGSCEGHGMSPGAAVLVLQT